MAKSRNRCLPMNMTSEDLLNGALRFVDFLTSYHYRLELMHSYFQMFHLQYVDAILDTSETGQKPGLV